MPKVAARAAAIEKRLREDGLGLYRFDVESGQCRDFIAHRVWPTGTPRLPTDWAAASIGAIPWIVRARVMPYGDWVSASSLLPEKLRPAPEWHPGPDAKPPAMCTVACQEARKTFPAECTCICEGEFHGGSGHPWRHIRGQLLTARDAQYWH